LTQRWHCADSATPVTRRHLGPASSIPRHSDRCRPPSSHRGSVSTSSTITRANWPKLGCRGDHAMSNLSTWIGCVILAACPLLGPAIAFSGSPPGRPLGSADQRWQGDSSSRTVRGWRDRQIYASPAVSEGAGRFRAGYCRFAGVVTANVIRPVARSNPTHPSGCATGRRLAGSPNALGIYRRGDRRHFPQIHIKPRSKDRRKA